MYNKAYQFIIIILQEIHFYLPGQNLNKTESFKNLSYHKKINCLDCDNDLIDLEPA